MDKQDTKSYWTGFHAELQMNGNYLWLDDARCSPKVTEKSMY